MNEHAVRMHQARQPVLAEGFSANLRAVPHGSRLRVGMIIPSVASNAEASVNAMLPAGVTLHTTRLKMDEKDAQSVLGFTDKVEEAASLLQDSAVDHILVNCTAVTTADPSSGERIRERILKATGLPSSTTGEGVIAALKRLGARKIVMLTPYRNDTNEREVAYLNHFGIDVVGWKGLELYGAHEFDQVTPEDWHKLALAHRHPDADAYFISCAQIRIGDVIGAIERDLQRPVITSNQSAIWNILRLRGINDAVPGFGTLMQVH